MQKQRGITLIALVITVIVLLILAGVTVATLTGDNGIFTQIAKANFYTEMQAVNEQKDLSKITGFMNQKIGDNTSALQVESDFLGENLGKNQETVTIVKNFSNTLKAEIVFARNNFGKGLMLDTKKIWRDNMYECQDLFSNDDFIGGVAKDFYYVSKDSSNGKENKYIYDSVTDICYKIEDTNIGSHTVHSLEYAKWILDGESMGGIGIVDDESGLMTSSDGTECYEPNLNNFSYKTEVIYYSQDLSTEKLVSVKEYIKNGKQKTIDGTYIFADYAQDKRKWANIKTTANGLEAYWVWIPRYAYKLDQATKKADIIFINLENKKMDGTDLPEGYVVHPTFLENNTLKGIWFSKYNPSSLESIPIDSTEPEIPDLSNFKEQDTKIIYYNENNLDDIKEVNYSENPEQMIEEGGKKYYFYKYESKMWANIKTIANGLESWWVWIPRFAYKLESGTSSVILIDANDKPIDKETYGDTLPQGYIVHEAFNQEPNLKGMWFSKYNPSSKEVGKTDKGEASRPDLSNFNSSKTKLIYYNENNLDDIKEVDYSENPNQMIEDGGKKYYFYKYENNMWANIKCENEGLVSYWTWIPRYAYKLESGTTNIILIDENNKPLNTEVYGNSLPQGYTVHEAFTQDGNLKGIWFSKYNPSQN